MNRKELIYELTKYELEWFSQNTENIKYVSDFFATNGFNSWSDEELQKMYDEFIKEEV